MGDRKEKGNRKQGVFTEGKKEIVTTVGPARFVACLLFSETCPDIVGDGRKPGRSAAGRPWGWGWGGFFQSGFLFREFSIKGFFGSSPKSLV